MSLGVLKKSLLDMLANYHYEADIMVDAKNLAMDDVIDILTKTSLLSVIPTIIFRLLNHSSYIGAWNLYRKDGNRYRHDWPNRRV